MAQEKAKGTIVNLARTTGTPVNGSDTFPATENDFYTAIETIARQELSNVKSVSTIEDGLFYYDLTEDNGTVIQQMLIDKAKSQAFNPNECNKAPHDPDIVVRYFQKWDTRQYYATVRRDEVRAIIANKGVSVEDASAAIIDTATQGNGSDEFKSERDLIMTTTVTDFATVLGGTPANMKGVLFAIREAYNYIKGENTFFTTSGFATHTPESDIRIALTERVMNLIDVGELANVINLSKEELFGKLVIIPTTDQPTANLYKVVVYDRKAFNRARRIYDLMPDECVSARFKNWILTVEDMYFYSPLFKATSIDVTTAATAQFNALITPNPAPNPGG